MTATFTSHISLIGRSARISSCSVGDGRCLRAVRLPWPRRSGMRILPGNMQINKRWGSLMTQPVPYFMEQEGICCFDLCDHRKLFNSQQLLYDFFCPLRFGSHQQWQSKDPSSPDFSKSFQSTQLVLLAASSGAGAIVKMELDLRFEE